MKLINKFALLLIVMTLIVSGLICLSIELLKHNLIEARKHEIQSILKFTVSQVHPYIEQQKKGQLSLQEAEDKVITLLSRARYDNYYIWANDANGIARVHVKDSVLGAFQASYPKYVNAITQQSPIFFTTGESKKPHSDALYVKVNGMTLLPDWRWMIGIGVYIDELDNILSPTILLLVIVGGILWILLALVLLWFYFSTLNLVGRDPQQALTILRRVETEGIEHFIRDEFNKGSLLSLVQERFYQSQQICDEVQDIMQKVTTQSSVLDESLRSVLDEQKTTQAKVEHLIASLKDNGSLTFEGESLVLQLVELIKKLSQLTKSSGELKQNLVKAIDEMELLDS
ncbi:cache domain-containing protein [Marinomonas sp. THO17]|uniref:cache domain-containing protein n=1 Tax=Marinomonas sp. THO17 TaxID=3149048 RepID=UPI00336C0B56